MGGLNGLQVTAAKRVLGWVVVEWVVSEQASGEREGLENLSPLFQALRSDGVASEAWASVMSN